MDSISMLNNLPGMAFECISDTPRLSFTFVSEGCKELTGRTPQELTSGIKLLDIVHPSDTSTMEKLIETTLSIGMPLETTFRIITKEQDEKWVWLSCRLTDTDSGGLPYVFEGFCTDISRQLRNETAKLANRAKTDFLGRMSLEIRTPMNSIIGMAELGLREEMPDVVREYTKVIKNAGSRLMSVLNDILDFSEIESGELQIISEEYNLSALLVDVAMIAKQQADEVSLDFAMSVGENIPGVLIGDMLRLRQIMLILLSNAVKFTDEGYVNLTVEGESNEGSTNLTITVEDTGRGINGEDIDEIFKEFTQFDTKNIEGIGLGLAIARNMAQLMGGDITVTSMFGVGSIFTLTLPQLISESEFLQDTRKSSAQFIAPSARILIVDDISANLWVAEGLLRPYKMQIDSCTSGAEAIEAVKTNRYDLIFMDHMMPVMNGVEATLCIRGLNDYFKTDCKNVPIVALTANATYGKKEMFLKSGFNDFLAKPIDTTQLDGIISKWIPEYKQEAIDYEQKEDEKADFEIAGIDVNAGIAMTGGSVEVYLKIIEVFCENGRRLVSELQKCFESGEMELYGIHAHAIKSSSASIGANEISASAKALEHAVGEGDFAFVQENNQSFLQDLTTLLDNITPVVQKEMSNNAIDMAELKRELTALKTAMEEYDVVAINECAKDIQKYLSEAEVSTTVNKILQYKMTGEFEEAVELINTLLGV